MSVNPTLVDTNLMEKGIAALVRSGSYPSREAILQESFTLFLRNYPEHRLLMAIELYQAALVPLNQAAALAGLPPFDFKAVLQARAIDPLKPSSHEIPRRKWGEIAGTAPYPLVGEDAQDWVSRTRLEGDQERQAQWNPEP